MNKQDTLQTNENVVTTITDDTVDVKDTKNDELRTNDENDTIDATPPKNSNDDIVKVVEIDEEIKNKEDIVDFLISNFINISLRVL